MTFFIYKCTRIAVLGTLMSFSKCLQALSYTCMFSRQALRSCRGLLSGITAAHMCHCSSHLLLEKQAMLSVSWHRALHIFPLSHRSMRPHWYGLELSIDPLCLVLVLGHYSDDRVTFSRGVRVERRVFNSLHHNKAWGHWFSTLQCRFERSPLATTVIQMFLKIYAIITMSR